MIDLPLIEISYHCHRLSKVADELGIDGWNIEAWLNVASGIFNVDIDSARYDDCAWLCNPIGEYEDKRSELLSKMVLQLVVFNFIWGSLESLIGLINPPDHPDFKGKINKTCFYLKQNMNQSRKLPYYSEIVWHFRNILSKLEYYNDYIKEFKHRPHVNEVGVGLYVVYKIRNDLAHGTLVIPNPDMEEDHEKPELDVDLISTCSRIVLLTIQMLLISLFKDTRIKFANYDEENEESADIETYLYNLHIETEPEREREQPSFQF